MRAIIQRVSSATVRVDGAERASIGHGLLVLVGLYETDVDADLARMADKIAGLRIFEDEQGKMNRSVIEAAGAVLLVPNFTVAGSAQKGRRPSFDRAMRPERAKGAFGRLAALVAGIGVPVQCGVFRTHMQVTLVNDGPVTIVVVSGEE